MEKLKWTDDLSVGVDLIDGQHKKWIDYYNGAVEALHSMQGPSRIASTLGFLMDYTKEHFHTEEMHMRRLEYPGFSQHLMKHEELRKTLTNLVQDYEEDGATNPLAGSIDTFLGNWLVNHIKDVDMKLGDFLKEKGIILPE